MPATGLLAPERILVAVLAIAPVAGNPPNRGDAIFATPCAINSTFGLCLSPLMRSETTADISDSMAPSIATVIAGESSAIIACSVSWLKWGGVKCGIPRGMPPKRVPMVSTSSFSRIDSAVPANNAMMVPGTRLM